MKKFYTDVIVNTGAALTYSSFGGYVYSPNNTTTEKEFDTYDEAVTAAKKTSAKLREDVTIYTIDSVVKFPVDDYKVEKVD